MRIAVDAMGGDDAPMATVRGALLAAALDPKSRYLLVGDEAKIRSEIDSVGWGEVSPSSIEVIPAADSVGMGESPIEALRKKKDTSILKAARLVADHKADALVSAGNTGATVAATTLSLKLLKGVRRPGIAVTVPAVEGVATIIDVGANIQCKPIHLYQYALMASAYHQHIYRHPDPKVGLLNIGAEVRKGNDLVRKTADLLGDSSLHFSGYVEGQEIYKGDCQVFVCDGFTGNMILKVSEGVAVGLIGMMKKKLSGEAVGRAGEEVVFLSRIKKWFFGRLMGKMKGIVDYSEYGGAPLLGVDGVCIIAHGRSDPKAIANAIRVAKEFSLHDVNKHIVEQLEPSRELDSAGKKVG
ncbi:MAG: phosphate acyltransferase PlsX [Planctomycetota bacterium]|nr:phosphate acyltransferase PlsX [Planctomycetota bacterium]